MKTLSRVLLIVLALIISIDAYCKSYRTPVAVTYEHSKDIGQLVPGDDVETVIRFKPFIDINKMTVKIITSGTELSGTPQDTTFTELKAGQAVELKIRIRLVDKSGSVSLNYFTFLPDEEAFGALKICCYGESGTTP